MKHTGRNFIYLAFAALLLMGSALSGPAYAQLELLEGTATEEAADPEPAIEAAPAPVGDTQIAERLTSIYAQIDAMRQLNVNVKSGVVTLTGEVPSLADAERAEAIAARVSGVVTVENSLERNLDVAANLDPVQSDLKSGFQKFLNSLPLIGIALVIFILFWMLGSFLSKRSAMWRRIAPNVFLAELFGVTIKLIFIVAGLIIALDLLQATALMGAILGSAGVLGLAIGFAIRDTVDNYISSIMLSIRQPFRANDHVVIGDREGRVIRLTSRATILMTLDGNHLRIPNSTVFKAEILNYTTNPERRFDFEMGIDADDDPASAIKVGLEKLRSLDFVLNEPTASARVENVGDSNIVIRYLSWVDQTHTDYYKARSAAIRTVKIILEENGFGLPEPIYRLRFDGRSDPLEIARKSKVETAAQDKADAEEKSAKARTGQVDAGEMDVSKDTDIEEKVQRERVAGNESDILNEHSPTE